MFIGATVRAGIIDFAGIADGTPVSAGNSYDGSVTLVATESTELYSADGNLTDLGPFTQEGIIQDEHVLLSPLVVDNASYTSHGAFSLFTATFAQPVFAVSFVLGYNNDLQNGRGMGYSYSGVNQTGNAFTRNLRTSGHDDFNGTLVSLTLPDGGYITSFSTSDGDNASLSYASLTIDNIISTSQPRAGSPWRDDFDGDARSDVLWRNTATGLVGSWTSGAGFENFGTETGGWAVIGSGDFDGDGRIDVLWHNTSTGLVASWTSGGSFATFGTEGDGWVAIKTGDFDGDGRGDVLWRNTATHTVAAWTSGAGFKSFGVEDGNWAVIDVADFDGDGKTDILWHNTSTGVVASWTSGAGYRIFGTEGGGWAVIGTGDFDGDNWSDVLWHDTSTGLVAAWTSSLGFKTFGTEGGGWTVIGSGDFDGDGRFDVLWRDTASGLVAAWLSSGGFTAFGVEGSGWAVIE